MDKRGDFPLSYFQTVGEWLDFTVVTKLQNAFNHNGHALLNWPKLCKYSVYFKIWLDAFF